jgi:hypothetical protein
VVVRVRMRYSGGSRSFMFGEAMSILARSTCARRGTRPRACAEEVEVLLDAAVAVGAGLARLGHGAAVGAHLLEADWLST